MAIAKSKNSTYNQVYLKASNFCAYQERTQQEVRGKLYGEGIDKDLVEEVISQLISENFINEERFAKSYAGGKFRMKKWGRTKIIFNLKAKGLSPYCIKKGIEEIDDKDYYTTLKDLIEKKSQMEKEKNILKKKHKIGGYLIRKGFESEIVWEELNDFFEK